LPGSVAEQQVASGTPEVNWYLNANNERIWVNLACKNLLVDMGLNVIHNAAWTAVLGVRVEAYSSCGQLMAGN